jgi:outer membrane protein assembly factor BamB
VVFSWKGRDLVAASNRDGKIYLLDSASLKTSLATSAKYASYTTDYAPGALTSWADSSGTRWILAGTNSAVVAFKVSDEQGKPVLTQAWTSRDLAAPVAPVVVNGVVFALSSGEFHSSDASLTAAQRAQRSQPAVLYALDAFTGKELWNSGRTITSFSPHSAGLAFSTGQVYVVTYDNTLYAFGFEQKEN